MNKITILNAAKNGVRAFKTKRWVRITVGAVTALTIFSAGVDSGRKEGDPHNSGPGSTATISQLEGKWDGIGVMPDGTPFCVVGWPCEDGFLDK